MNKKDWKALEKRYYAGETSLDEEALLRAYWQERGKPEEALLANYFVAQRQIQLSAVAEQHILRQLKRKTAYRQLYAQLAIAASLLILLAAWWLASPRQSPLETSFPLAENTSWEKYEITDPVLAANILEESLRSLAKGWKTGQDQAVLAIAHGQKLEQP